MIPLNSVSEILTQVNMPSSDLPGPADPALRVSGSHIHPHMCG